MRPVMTELLSDTPRRADSTKSLHELPPVGREQENEWKGHEHKGLEKSHE